MSPERLEATMPSPVILQHVAGTDITDTMVEQAAELFSRFYGVWGLLADQHLGSFAKQGDREQQCSLEETPFLTLFLGRRVRMSAANLRRQILPDHGDNSYVRAMVGNELVGNVFATRYDIVSDGPSTSKACWITQLCVDPRYRRQGLATKVGLPQLIRMSGEAAILIRS
jgi:ribosomal protein S18 acetylase RimI-like enzyme